jgi:hypothetical protein
MVIIVDSEQDKGSFSEKDFKVFQEELFFNKMNKLTKEQLITEIMINNAQISELSTANQRLVDTLNVTSSFIQTREKNTIELSSEIIKVNHKLSDIQNEVNKYRNKSRKYDIVLQRFPLMLGAVVFSIISAFGFGFAFSTFVPIQSQQTQTR